MNDQPIGVFDSGFGGVSVLAETVRALPEEDFIFLGDNLHAPYGDRTPQEVLDFTRQAVDQLIRLQCKAIVIACNTATSAAAETLRKELTLPIIGMEPALKPASQLPANGAVLVMATAMTLRLDKFHLLMDRYGQNAVPVACPGLVELIEAGEISGPRIDAKIDELLSPWLKQPVKAVVLGCTHYIYLRPALRAYLPPGTALVDGNAGTARQLQNQLSQRNLLRQRSGHGIGNARIHAGAVTFLSTAPDERIPQKMRDWFTHVLAELDSACNSYADTVE